MKARLISTFSEVDPNVFSSLKNVEEKPPVTAHIPSKTKIVLKNKPQQRGIEVESELRQTIASICYPIEDYLTGPSERRLVEAVILLTLTKLSFKQLVKKFQLEDVSRRSFYRRLKRYKKAKNPYGLVDGRKLADKKQSRLDRYLQVLTIAIYDALGRMAFIKSGKRSTTRILGYLKEESKKSIHISLCIEFNIKTPSRGAEDIVFELPSYRQLDHFLEDIDLYREKLTENEKACLIQLQGLVGPAVVELDELWVIDSTTLAIKYYDSENKYVCIAPISIVLDAKSRECVAYRVHFCAVDGKESLLVLRDALIKYGAPCKIRSDNISYYLKGRDFDRCLEDLNIEHPFIPEKSPWFNGVLERLNRTIHSFTLASLENFCEINDPDQKKLVYVLKKEAVLSTVKKAFDTYNNDTAHSMLNGATPMEIRQGMVKESKARQLSHAEINAALNISVEARVVGQVAVTKKKNGNFYSEKLAGWNGEKITLRFPIVEEAAPVTAWYGKTIIGEVKLER